MHTSTLGLGVPKWLYLAVLCVNTPKPTFLIRKCRNNDELHDGCISDDRCISHAAE